MEPKLKLLLKPVWDEIDHVRSESMGFLQGLGLPDETVDAVTMVACELTENAVKYGSFDSSRNQIDVTLTVGGSSVVAEVRSPVPRDDDGTVARLDQMVQWIRGYQDPYEAYLERLKVVSAQSFTSKESGLGLVRIAYEGHSILDLYVDDRQMLAVSAVHPIERAAGGQS